MLFILRFLRTRSVMWSISWLSVLYDHMKTKRSFISSFSSTRFAKLLILKQNQRKRVFWGIRTLQWAQNAAAGRLSISETFWSDPWIWDRYDTPWKWCYSGVYQKGRCFVVSFIVNNGITEEEFFDFSNLTSTKRLLITIRSQIII